MRSGLVLVLSVFMAAAIFAGGASVPAPYDPSLDGLEQLQDAGAAAGASGKRVFVVVGGNWCKWCRAFDALVASDQALAAAISRDYVLVHLNYSKENKNQAALERLGNPNKLGFPAFVVLSPELEPITTQATEVFETGDKDKPGHDPAKLIAWLGQWKRPGAGDRQPATGR
jgi:thiol:disulfide interchange protein